MIKCSIAKCCSLRVCIDTSAVVVLVKNTLTLRQVFQIIFIVFETFSGVIENTWNVDDFPVSKPFYATQGEVKLKRRTKAGMNTPNFLNQGSLIDTEVL